MAMKFKHGHEVIVRSLNEESVNAILHGFGALLAAAGLVLLAVRACGGLGGSPAGAKSLSAFVVFAATMIVMFTASTFYHSARSGKGKSRLQILDHQAIYLFIAGSYTPFCLVALPPRLGWVILALEWLCAAAGVILYMVNCPYLKKFELAIYLIMGWAIAAGVPFLRERMSTASIVFLVAGGLSYTLGVFWYVRKWKRGAHVVWHSFVLVGAVCHWWSVWFFA
jgi:hemolysin III